MWTSLCSKKTHSSPFHPTSGQFYVKTSDLVQDGVGDRKSWKMAIFKKIRKNPEKVKNREKWRFFWKSSKKSAKYSPGGVCKIAFPPPVEERFSKRGSKKTRIFAFFQKSGFEKLAGNPPCFPTGAPKSAIALGEKIWPPGNFVFFLHFFCRFAL